mmetsp:Transcript_34402/g.74366  ORF Transcript_34402/g.74366 Transcript_34402/m.74366 type:complete len:80 (-) Transcript_34402:41-280(-)
MLNFILLSERLVTKLAIHYLGHLYCMIRFQIIYSSKLAMAILLQGSDQMLNSVGKYVTNLKGQKLRTSFLQMTQLDIPQ